MEFNMSEKKYVINNKKLISEWNWEKNNAINIYPDKITCGSGIKIWWKCNNNHEWQATINSRNNGRGCPYCSNKKVLKGYNDLQTVNPILANDWDYEKNGQLKPIDVLSNSHKKVSWKCNNGHSWESTIADRNNGNGCPYCSGRYAIKGRNDLLTVNPTLASEWNHEKNKELTPNDVLPNSDKKVWWKCNKGHEWQATVGHRSNGRGCPICDSERKTSMPEFTIVYYLKKYGLEAIHSYKALGYELDIYIPSKKIAIEYDGSFWHKNRLKNDLEKNLKCKKDGIKLYRLREGLPSLNNYSIDYIIQGKQNNFCQVLEKILSEIIGIKIDINLEKDIIDIENLREYTEKKNSLFVSNPKVAREWNYERNGNLTPEQFFAHSNKKVWWKCIKGHEWQANINDRNNGRGCPFCASKKVFQGYNDLAIVNPTLASEWNYEKNNGLKPIDVLPNSHKLVWWKCLKGHEWQAVIKSRNSGNGCPYCANKKVLKGYNDLQTINPVLASEWDYKKNGVLTPMDVFPNSNKKVWWKCRNGHVWKAIISDRNKVTNCPECYKNRFDKTI